MVELSINIIKLEGQILQALDKLYKSSESYDQGCMILKELIK